MQIADDMKAFAKYLPGIHIEAVYGGASIIPQMKALRKGVDIIVATPGRLIDLMERGVAQLDHVSNVVFDFEDTRFMDSSGIGIIMGRYRKISCFGGKVYAINVGKQILRILKLSGMNRLVEVLGNE